MAPQRTASDSPRIFLLDGMALAYRAHFAFLRNPLTNAHGVQTSAVFGFLSALDRVLLEEQPEEIVVVFDGPEDTFRHALYPDYKATRQKMPEEMIPQLAWIRQCVEALGITFLQVAGYEADDIIGTLATQGEAAGKDVWIVSGDKDMLQLVTEKVRLYNVMKPGRSEPEIMGIAETIEKFGVPPEKVVDLLGLMGDSSDNVPGVPNVGPKTALTLVQQFGGLDEALEHAEEVTQKRTRERLIEFAEQARLSKRLVTIDRDVPLPAGVSLVQGKKDIPLLRSLYDELNFRGRLERLEAGDDDVTPDVAYRLVDTPGKLKKLVQALESTRETGGFAWDTETTGIDPHRAKLVGLSFAWVEGEAWYVPVNLDPPMFAAAGAFAPAAAGTLFDQPVVDADAPAVMERLRGVLEDPTLPKTGQNMKYDIHIVRRYGVDVAGIDFDTMIASFCADPGSRIHNLDGLALRHLGLKKIPTSALIGKGKNEITMAEVDVAKVAEYACEDADVTWRLRGRLQAELEEKNVTEVFRKAEMPLVPVLARMERNGIRLAVERLEAIGTDLDGRIEAAEAEIHKFKGEPFNIRSTAILGALLFDELELHKKAGRKQPKKTAKGSGYATDESTLAELAPYHELPQLVLTYRSLSKLKSTYLDTLPTYVNPETGRVHTSFHQTGAATGRLSSSDPNMQNIPIRSEEGRAIRTAFVPEEGWTFLSADYSQIELRLLAHLSGDEGLRAAFRAGEDIHRATAARIFKVAPEDVTSTLRSRAKAVNFGVIYGMGAQRLARETSVTLQEAKSFIDNYFATYPAVKAYQDQTIETARETGYVMTLLGRRRYLPDLLSGDPRVFAQARNVAVNTPLQGTAADLIKLAMIRIDQRLTREGYAARMLLQIHDELLFEAPPGEMERLVAMVTEEMQGAMPLDVPIVVDTGQGANWSEAH
ncbi:MAG: DNA polymerase I [Planctomycetota bacterium]|nr:DNA polymerase I [Planctomycetota bacterium]